MARIYFKGKAAAVAQVTTVQITGDDAATTYTVTIGGVIVSVAGAGTGVNATALALQLALAASTHPYFSTVTWTPSTDTVTGTANTAGVPFTAVASKSGGTGTIGAATEATAPTGPNHYDEPENWSAGAVPVANDVADLGDFAGKICWGMDASGVALDGFDAPETFTGRIGLDYQAFATSSDCDVVDVTVPEYRATYLQIGCTKADGPVRIGHSDGPTGAGGSGRILLDMGATAAQVDIHSTAALSYDDKRPCVRIKANSSSTDIYVRSAVGGVGIATEVPGETSTVGAVAVSSTSDSDALHLGPGVTLTSYAQTGGSNSLRAAATVAAVTVDAGTLWIEGDYTITKLVNDGGLILGNHKKTGGNAVTVAHLNAGTTDTLGSSEARTWATVYRANAATFRYDDTIVTVTTLNEPSVDQPEGLPAPVAPPLVVALGNVTGPVEGSSTDNAVVRWDGTDGTRTQDSSVTVDDNGNVDAASVHLAGNLRVAEVSAPTTPPSGTVEVYAKADGALYIKDDTGAETDLTQFSGTLSIAQGGTARTAAPTHPLILMASGGMGTATTGGGDANQLPEQTEAATNDINYHYLAMATGETVFWNIAFPVNWDGGTMTARLLWTAASGSDDVKFEIQGGCLGDGDAIDAALGSAQSVEDTLLTAVDVHITPATAAITFANAAAGEYTVIEVKRVAPAGVDLGVDLRLLGVRLEYTAAGYSES